MLSKIFKFAVKLVSEVFGTLILTVTIFCMFYTGFTNEGAMRIIGPISVLVCGIFAYVVIMLIANKSGKNKKQPHKQ